ncbi:S-layer homology domain-containing protein [Metasolibacillus sp.]|uniref:S-layer homology domain-containing protein n=1 Tax=Metasolibacillus sp. TaxID=2703680 RepID=UPI0025EDA931|nr:S-layer homology domain-containing protein [Metasolibacillus sp.]MCT6924399.1 S-layer homology domain-containing protein [Metasolibacillus sp.]MCT6940514.1 S-layer homology domain-containing protein [Metasolibacillus sp.]
MKKNKLFIVATAGLVATTTVSGVGITTQAATTSFSDVKEKSSHYPAIMDLAQRGIIQGYPDGTFKPNEVVTYAQVAKIIAGVIGVEGTSEELLQLIGVTESPNQPVTRYSMATIIAQALQLPTTEKAVPFTDVASEYQAAVAALFTNGITAGTSATTFSGERYVTRGQLATFVVRAERMVQAVPTIIGATLMVKDVQNNQLITDEQQWSIDAKARAILNAKNAEALAGAQLDVIIEDGKIVEVLAIDLKTSGQSEAYAVLDGGGTSVGNIIVNADFIELKNMKIVADLRVAGKTSNIALDKVDVVGQIFLQEAEVPKTASLTKVATNFYTDGVRLYVRNGQVSSITTQGQAQINSDVVIPYIQVLGPALEVNAPNVGLVEMHSWMHPQQILSGMSTIDILSAASPDVVSGMLDNLRKIQKENEEFIKKLAGTNAFAPTEQELRIQLESVIAAIVREAEQKNHLTQEQIKVLLEQSAAKSLDFSKNLSEELNKIYGPQLGSMLQRQLVQEHQQQQRLQELERQKKIQEQQRLMQQIQEQARLLQQSAQQQQQISQINLQGSLQINNALLPSDANTGLTLSEGIKIGNITTNLTKEQLLQRLTARSGQIGTLTLANGQQSPFNSTPPTNSNTGGGSSGGGNTGGTTPTPPKLEVASLEAMIQKAKDRRVKIEALQEYEPILESGDAISYTKKWMPQSVVDALDKAIADAEKMLTEAKGTKVANVRVASLADAKIQLAVTQPDITQMVAKLESLIALKAVEGLKEKKWLYDTLNGKEISGQSIPPANIPDGMFPPAGTEIIPGSGIVIPEGISKEEVRVLMAINPFIAENPGVPSSNPLEFVHILGALLNEMGKTEDTIRITDTQILMPLFEGLSDTDPATQQSVTFVEALKAEITIKATQVEITGMTYTTTGMTLTYTSSDINPDMLYGKTVDLEFGNGQKRTDIEITDVSNNEIFLEFEMHPDDRSSLESITLQGYQFNGLPINAQSPEVTQITVTGAILLPNLIEPSALPNELHLLTNTSNLDALDGVNLDLDFGEGTIATGTVLPHIEGQPILRVQITLTSLPTLLHAVTVDGYQFNLAISSLPIIAPPQP